MIKQIDNLDLFYKACIHHFFKTHPDLKDEFLAFYGEKLIEVARGELDQWDFIERCLDVENKETK